MRRRSCIKSPTFPAFCSVPSMRTRWPSRRRHDYARLKDALARLGVSPKVLICRIAEDACPLVLPVRVKDRDALRRRLMEHRIYCAVHWPFDGVQADERPLARIRLRELFCH